MTYLSKGTRVQVRRVVARPLGTVALSGFQLKTEARVEEFEGEILHIWGDKPVDPTKVTLQLKKDDGSLVEVDVHHVMEVVP